MNLQKTDFVYILGIGSRWGKDNELKYSLRSLAENVPHRNVFIVGECPPWAGDITHIFEEDPHRNKILNGALKVRRACLDDRISDPFVLMNDDFFFLSPVEKIENYIRESFPNMIRNHRTKGGYYYHSITRTLDFLKNQGFDWPDNFEVHYPMVIHKKKFLESQELIPKDGESYLFRSVYGNFQGLAGARIARDFKTETSDDFPILKEGPFLSSNKKIIRNKEFRVWLKNRFPNPSQYE